MSNVVDLHQFRVAPLVGKCAAILDAANDDERAEATFVRLRYDELGEDAPHQLEHRRDELATALGMNSACSFRRIGMMLRGEYEGAAEEQFASRYFRTWVLGEVA